MDGLDEKQVMTGEGLLVRLKKEDWTSMLKKLHYYSLNRLQKFPAIVERFNTNNLATFFADEAIKQLWTGEREWNIIKYPDLYHFLKSAVDSLRYNFLKSKGVSNVTFITDQMEDTIQADIPDPESIYIAKQLAEKVGLLFKDDMIAGQVFDCIVNQIPPRIMSTELGIPVKDIYNIIKRINRKLNEFKGQLN